MCAPLHAPLLLSWLRLPVVCTGGTFFLGHFLLLLLLFFFLNGGALARLMRHVMRTAAGDLREPPRPLHPASTPRPPACLRPWPKFEIVALEALALDRGALEAGSAAARRAPHHTQERNRQGLVKFCMKLWFAIAFVVAILEIPG